MQCLSIAGRNNAVKPNSLFELTDILKRIPTIMARASDLGIYGDLAGTETCPAKLYMNMKMTVM